VGTGTMGVVARAMVASSSSMIGAQEISSSQQQMRVPFLSSSDAAVRPGPISIKFSGKLPGSKSRAGTAAAPAVFLRVNRVAALAMPKEKWNVRVSFRILFFPPCELQHSVAREFGSSSLD
jgi:hypothetical protein